MIKYLVKKVSDIKEEIDSIYKELLESKYQFVIIRENNKYMCLTKEKSLIEISNLERFINEAKEDIYYRSIKEDIHKVNKEDLKKYYSYLDKFKEEITSEVYGDKYLFGSVAVRVNDGFITTIRGKEDLSDYAYVNYVDHINKIVSVKDKKASLNAPLLATLFEDKNVDVIVHINHNYDKSLDSYDYAFPGSVRDSLRNLSKSFNISNHGVFYLIDSKGEIIR